MERMFFWKQVYKNQNRNLNKISADEINSKQNK